MAMQLTLCDHLHVGLGGGRGWEGVEGCGWGGGGVRVKCHNDRSVITVFFVNADSDWYLTPSQPMYLPQGDRHRHQSKIKGKSTIR